MRERDREKRCQKKHQTRDKRMPQTDHKEYCLQSVKLGSVWFLSGPQDSHSCSLKDSSVLQPQWDGCEVAVRHIHHPLQQQEETAKVHPFERYVQKLAQCWHLRSRDMMRTSKLLHTNEPSQYKHHVVVLIRG